MVNFLSMSLQCYRRGWNCHFKRGGL